MFTRNQIVKGNAYDLNFFSNACVIHDNNKIHIHIMLETLPLSINLMVYSSCIKTRMIYHHK